MHLFGFGTAVILILDNMFESISPSSFGFPRMVGVPSPGHIIPIVITGAVTHSCYKWFWFYPFLSKKKLPDNQKTILSPKSPQLREVGARAYFIRDTITAKTYRTDYNAQSSCSCSSFFPLKSLTGSLEDIYVQSCPINLFGWLST